MWGRRTYTPQFGRRLAELMAAVKKEPVSERPLLYKSSDAAPAQYAPLFLLPCCHCCHGRMYL